MTQTVRRFSPCGPCITLGPLTKETAKFYCFASKYDGRAKKIAKTGAAHVEACHSCRDHAQTCYPNGYMD
jgi:hypothetical protein